MYIYIYIMYIYIYLYIYYYSISTNHLTYIITVPIIYTINNLGIIMNINIHL